MKIVGGMKISPFIFYNMTIREAKLAIKGHTNEMRENYISNLYATTNSIGSCFGGKNFKPIDPFGNMPQSTKTSAEYVANLKAFGIDARDVDETEFKENWKELSLDERRNLLFDK